MKTYAKAVDLVTTRDGKCPDGYVEVESPIANGGLSALLDHAFSVLESLGVPRTRAGSVSNGIMVLDQRHQRQHQGDQAAYSALVTEHERTEAELAAAKAAISDHNKAVLASCVSNATMRGCDSYTKRGRQCPDCPKDWLIDLPDGAPTLTDLAECEAIGAAVEAVHHYTDSDDVPRGMETDLCNCVIGKNNTACPVHGDTAETACEQVKCLHPLHHGWHDRKDDCVHPMTRREFSDYEPKTEGK